MIEAIEKLKRSFCDDDPALFRAVLAENPELKRKINDPVAAFDAPPVTQVRSRGMLDALLEAGADINAKSRWWAGGFGLLHLAPPEIAAYAIERGAVVDIHAAARLGMLDRVRELATADPNLVHARGGDGQTPLHFASTVEIAGYLLDQGADIDALDVDHESTPAQYMVRDRQDVARLLIWRGCRTDILMAAALGDASLARSLLDADPACIRVRVSHAFFPMAGQKSGGTIYQWALGWYVSPHDVARKFGHTDVLQLLIDRSPPDVALLDACWTGDEEAAKLILARHPGLVEKLSDSDRRQMAHAAQNNNTAAVKAMLAAGLPVDASGRHNGTPLHWACFLGNAAMTREILRYHPPLEVIDSDFQATPLGWVTHGSKYGWNVKTGDFTGTVEALLEAGVNVPEKIGDCTDEVRKAIDDFVAKRPAQGFAQES